MSEVLDEHTASEGWQNSTLRSVFHLIVQMNELTGNVSGYICNHGSLNRERDTASPRGRYGERYTHAGMLRGVQANVVQRRALSQLYQAKGVAHGTVDAVSDITL